MLNTLIPLLIKGLCQTLCMVGISCLLACLLGMPLGILLVLTEPQGLQPKPIFYRCLGSIINALRSLPFIILLVAITPLTRIIAGTSIGTIAAIIPLTIGAIPFTARIIENALHEVPAGLIEAGVVMGASTKQIIWKFMLPEALPAIVEGLTVVLISLIGYSAMAGAIGGGGLGEIALYHGYYRYHFDIMLATVFVLIVLVQLLQMAGSKLAQRLRFK